jgi:histidinol-phosphate aminotransferase
VPFVAPEALERQLGGPFRVRLGANESSFGPSPKACEAMRAALDRLGWYGDPESHELRERLAHIHSVSKENIVVGPGADDLLSLCARTFIEPGQSAVNSLGGYPTFNYVVQGVGGNLHLVPYLHDRVDIHALAEMACGTGANVVYMANPDNPSGTWHSSEGIARLLEALPAGCVLLLDEAYSDFAPLEAIPPIEAADTRIIRIRTFSKAHGMAGARIGYAIASAEVIASFNKIRMHFAVNRVAQAGALASLEDAEFIEHVVAETLRGREEYIQMAADAGLTTLPSATNFVSIDLGSFEAAKAAVDGLLQEGVFVRMPGAAPLNRCVRITIGTPQEREILRGAFEGVVKDSLRKAPNI